MSANSSSHLPLQPLPLDDLIDSARCPADVISPKLADISPPYVCPY